MIHVCHKKDKTPGAVYIGRGSPLGNPCDFTGSTHADVKYRANTREEAIEFYKSYLDEKIRLHDPVICEAINGIFIKKVKGEDIFLECYCAQISVTAM